MLLWDLGFFAALHCPNFPVWLRSGDADEDPMDAEIRKMMEQQHPGTLAKESWTCELCVNKVSG